MLLDGKYSFICTAASVLWLADRSCKTQKNQNKMSMNKLELWIYVCADDWMTEWAIIASNVMGWQNRLKFSGKTNQLKISLQNAYFYYFV